MTSNAAILRNSVPCHPGDHNTNSAPIVNDGPAKFSRALASASLAMNPASIVLPLSPGRHLRSRSSCRTLSSSPSRCLLISKRIQRPGGNRLRQLSIAVQREFAGAVPSWIMARIEAKVARKQAEKCAVPTRPRLIKGKWREK